MTPKNERRVDLLAAALVNIITLTFAALSIYLMIKSYHIIWGN